MRSASVPQMVVLKFSKGLLQAGNKRFLSSSGAAGNRLSGRSRFYKEVGIEHLRTPPWDAIKKKSPLATLSHGGSESIASTIAAGVDGSQSATGVHHIPQSKNNSLMLTEMLTPRLPGEEPTISNESAYDSNCYTSWYGVTLDGRKISTPLGQTLAVPSETLAYMIAAEWDSQTKQLQPSNMPLMTLACTVLDQAAFHPQFYRDAALKYLPTDTICFWADPTEDRLLHRRQQQAWKGLHDFCEEQLDGKPTTAFGIEGILMSRKRGGEKPNSGLPHPDKLIQAATRWTHSLDAWHLAALNSIATQSKSFLIAFSMLESIKLSKANHYITTRVEPHSTPFSDVSQASDASRVEEEFQISNWGLVEGQHDYDRLNSSVQLHSACLFVKTILFEKN